MAWGGSAPVALGVMWFLTALVFFFLCLRLYTRLVCLASYGIDDHIYAVAFLLTTPGSFLVFLLIFNVFTHLAADYGFGQTMAEIGDNDKVVQATLYECIGQAFAIVGMSIAKASLGAFLLRLVVTPWHRWVIWVVMTFVVLASIAQVLVFWLACVPLEFVYDRFIPGGTCPIDTRPTSYILCTSTIICDVTFAVLPWFIVHTLQMPRREKYTIALSFSLGLIAAAAGIVRMTTVSGLYTMDYLKDSVPLIVWSAAEMAVTLICIGIPVCRPVYRRVYHHFYPDSQTSGYRKQQYDPDNPSFALETIGGGRVNKSKTSTKERELGSHASANRDVESGNSDDGESFSGVKNGRIGHFSQARGGRGGGAAGPDNASDEEILGGDYWRNQVQPHALQDRNAGIVVTETVRVDRS